MPEFFGQNNSRGNDWASQRAAASFIDPGDFRDSNGAQFLFVTKTAPPVHESETTEKLKT
jgi:hypothetical protein